MTVNTLQARKLRVTVTIGADSNAADATTYVWTENRMRVNVSAGGGRFNAARIEIYGIGIDAINAISRQWLTPLMIRPQDTVRVDVWTGAQFVPFFFGTITWAAPKGSSMPAVPLVMEASAASSLAQSAPAPYSASGTVKLTDALAAILGTSGYTLIAAANLPQYTLTNPRASGSTLDQVEALLAGFPDIAHDYNLLQLRLRPVGAPLFGDVVTVGPAAGMQGSPDYSTSGVEFNTLFDPRITLGTPLQLETVFAYAQSAQWTVAVLEHVLEANVFNGEWLTRVFAQGVPNADGSGTAAAT
ncbi:hypothetical protein [Paraburkholderia mimosarum]|uniref:hypothetical protein n=1 Tax=Paraburkholderia mimosarum TaxID=312026 RepID=UPI0004278B3B|nr:hypothetical protein [Paraburkholderia mimosarum]